MESISRYIMLLQTKNEPVLIQIAFDLSHALDVLQSRKFMQKTIILNMFHNFIMNSLEHVNQSENFFK